MSINSANLPCPSCKTMNQMTARFCLNCGASLAGGGQEQTPYQPPAATQAPPMASEYLYAGFWKRLLAYIVDSMIYNLLMTMIAVLGFVNAIDFSEPDPGALMASLSTFYLIYYLGWWLYFALQESSTAQATLGKRLVGIKVSDMQGQPLSFMHAAGRQLGGAVSAMTFTIGYLMAAFTRRKQALHDLMAGCVVVNKNFDAKQIVMVNQNPPAGMSLAGIIGVLALVLVVPIGGIIAAISIPAYHDYSTRAKVSAAFYHAGTAKQPIVDYAMETGYWPSNFEQAGVSSSSMQSEDYYMQLLDDGVIAVTFKKPQAISGETIQIIPDLQNSGEYNWRCDGGEMRDSYLPQECR